MNIALIVLVSLCLAQDAAHGHSVAIRSTSSNVQDAITQGMKTVAELANTVGGAIVVGNDLLHKYSDNSTDYAAYFRIDVVKEITTSIETISKAFSDAANTVGVSNASALACLTAERNSTQTLAINVVEEVLKCGTTKVRQFVDLGIHLAVLANTTIFLVPNTNANIKNCDKEANDLFKIGCVGWQVAGATTQLARISVDVGVTVATGSALYGTIQADLTLCAQAKLFSFRQRAVAIPLTIGICLGKTALAG